MQMASLQGYWRVLLLTLTHPLLAIDIFPPLKLLRYRGLHSLQKTRSLPTRDPQGTRSLSTRDRSFVHCRVSFINFPMGGGGGQNDDLGVQSCVLCEVEL